MTFIRLSTLLVVLTVVLAGCSGGGVTDGAAGPSADTDSAASDSTDASSGDGTDTGDTTNAGGDGLSLADADARLRSAGSFTTEWSYSITEADGTTSNITSTYRVDLEENRSLERFSTSGPDGESGLETFIADGTAYSRYGDGEDAFYSVNERPTNVFDSATGRASGFYGSLEDDAQFVGTEQFDGDTLSRYEYDNTDAWQSYNQGLASGTFDTDEEVTITDFEIATLVDDDGIARLTTWTLTGETESGETVSVEWRYSLTDIGSTTVEDPDWLDEARSQS